MPERVKRYTSVHRHTAQCTWMPGIVDIFFLNFSRCSTLWNAFICKKEKNGKYRNICRKMLMSIFDPLYYDFGSHFHNRFFLHWRQIWNISFDLLVQALTSPYQARHAISSIHYANGILPRSRELARRWAKPKRTQLICLANKNGTIRQFLAESKTARIHFLSIWGKKLLK